MSKRNQKGQITETRTSWHLRFYEPQERSGKIVRVPVSRKIADKRECPTKTEARRRADDMLAPLNNGTQTPASNMLLTTWMAEHYLPYVQTNMGASTYQFKEAFWRLYLKDELGIVRLRELQTWQAHQAFQRIAAKHELGKIALNHCKAVLSSAYKHAMVCGIVGGTNPVSIAPVPEGTGRHETYAYSLDEIRTMLMLVTEPRAKLAICVAAFAGLRESEIRGLRWPDWNDCERQNEDGTVTLGILQIDRRVWQRDINDPKTERSKSGVPVITTLGAALRKFRAEMAEQGLYAAGGWVFASPYKGGRLPLRLDNLYRSYIVPRLTGTDVRWHGWHAFRRGLATNLHALGVDDKTIQGILRHENIQTTQAIYIKSLPETRSAALQQLEAVFLAPTQGREKVQ